MASLGHEIQDVFKLAMECQANRQEQPKKLPVVHKASSCELRHNDLLNWWQDPAVSVSEMARRIGVALATVSLHAAKNGFPFPRTSNRGVCAKPLLRTGKPRHWRSRDEVRETFLLLRYEYPRHNQKGLSREDRSTIQWLQRHDLAWLQKNRRTSARKGGNPGIDWKQRDEDCARRIPEIARRLAIRSIPLSISAFARELGWYLGNSYKRMPKTREALAFLVPERAKPRSSK
jgi:hypothetical protein